MMMGKVSLSLSIVFIFLISLSITSGKEERWKRDLHTDYGSYDLHLKTGSSRQSKLDFHGVSDNHHHQRGDVVQSGYEHSGGDQVQGLEQVGGSNEKAVQGLHKPEETRYTTTMSSSKPLTDVWYIGCFSTWEKQMTHMLNFDFNDEHTHRSCADICKASSLQVALLRGSECRCSAINAFNAMKIEDSYCSIPCPVKEYDPRNPSSWLPPFPCGGNLGYSVYCIHDGLNDCFSLKEQYKGGTIFGPRRKNEIREENDHEVKEPVLSEPCAKCDGNLRVCKKVFLFPDFDNFPVSSPQKCAAFCGKNVSFVGIGTFGDVVDEKIREPTAYARLTWLKKAMIDLPICSCVAKEDRGLFKAVSDSSVCNMPCPGRPDQICGGKENVWDDELYSTLFCVDGERNDECQAWESSPSTQTTSSSTTPFNPCSLDDYDCDEETGSTGWATETLEPSPSTTNVTEEETATDSITTEIVNNKTTPTPSSTTVSIPIVNTTTSDITSEGSTTTLRTTPSASCEIFCKKTDKYGVKWRVCSKSQGIKPCSALIPNVTGLAFWRCNETGQFETSNPDVRNCSSNWIEKQEEAIERIENFEDADDFMGNLYRNARNSTQRYFGHEIRNLVGFVDKVLMKSRNFSPDFKQFEGMVKTAVDLNAFLIEHQEPWEDLVTKDRSSISTDLIETMEGTLFHLTGAVQDERYQRIFTKLNATDKYGFLLLAETIEKGWNASDSESYEFPPNGYRGLHDSFIKLPTGWEGRVRHDKVEIAAMSMDSDYVSFIMPGQYDNFVSASSVDGNEENSKLINGKMISLSLTSSPNDVLQRNMNGVSSSPSITFGDRGAEITFYHDIEAWGSDKQLVHRKLHVGEKPKAVLGSTDCVYWNTMKHTWSSDGCKIVRRSRYETVCECSHLTSFAVLMDVHRYVGKQLGLELLTLILCPISEVALVLSIIILSSVNGLQKIRNTITTNLSACLLVGNGLVLFVLDRNYFNMSEGLCIGSAMITHYIYLCAFMWMLIEGIQLYRMVVHVFDSGRSYIKHFGVVAYGSPLIIIAITATTGYLKGDKPYGGDIYCWLEGSYVWSFMGPVALIVMVNMVILFIALKTAYQLQQSKKQSPTFLMGKIRSCKTWFKGCFSLTVILGLTWAVGFFTLMNGTSGIVAAYLFTILNASQGLFIFLFNCVFNDKVRSFTQRNLSTYLPSWLTSSVSSGPEEASAYGKRSTKKRSSRYKAEITENPRPYTISRVTTGKDDEVSRQGRSFKTPKVDFIQDGKTRNRYISENDSSSPVQRSSSVGTISSADSIPGSIPSDNGNMSSDNSQNALISKIRVKNF